jgi:iron complex outermembrane receptor protein
VRITGGIRYTKDDKSFTGESIANTLFCTRGFLGCPGAPVFPYTQVAPSPPNFNPFAPGANGTQTFLSDFTQGPQSATYSRTTWRAAAETDLTEQNFLYASVETGYRSGGFSFSTDAETQTFKPETIHAYTIGSKNRFLDNRLQANLEFFYYKYRDQQIAHLDLSSNPQNPLNPIVIFPTENVGRSTYKGIELDLQARPLRNTLVSLDVQYENGVYDDFVYHTPNQNRGVSNGTGCRNAAAPGLFYTIDCSGFQPPMTPRWTGTLGLQQTVPLPNGASMVGEARAHYQSSTYTGRYFLPTELTAGYGMWDFNLTYHSASDHYFVGAYLRNAFNKTANNFSFAVPFSAFETGLLMPPRTYGARVGVSF